MRKGVDTDIEKRRQLESTLSGVRWISLEGHENGGAKVGELLWRWGVENVGDLQEDGFTFKKKHLKCQNLDALSG